VEWSIQDVAKAAGTTSRTLRHYGQLGLLTPSRTASNGHRCYDRDAMVRLQRILRQRELGLHLPSIARVLSGQQDTTSPLEGQPPPARPPPRRPGPGGTAGCPSGDHRAAAVVRW